MASSSSCTKVCFNSTCKEVLELPRQGWLRRTGEFADLCDRCGSAFKDGKFCDTYHLNASGWRCCESCGKQIHCGCIVSFHMFVLLDAGGIECINCAKAEYLLTPNPAWSAASRFLPVNSGRISDISAKNWSSIAGSGPVPWRQAPSLFTAAKAHPALQPRTPFEVDIPYGIDKCPVRKQSSASSLDKGRKGDFSERLMNENLRIGASGMVGDRTTGVQFDGRCKLFGNVPHQSSCHANEHVTPLSTLPTTFVAKDQITEQEKLSGMHGRHPTPPKSGGKQLSGNSGLESSHEAQAQNGKHRGETRGRNHLVPRYWPKITDQELQQISGDSNARITPLFEKVLSASDAGKIGRLVLPKKCAEAYLPPISQPEGLPLVVKDLKGKDWVLQFRFWPNNNSRMYVLEGVTPCIQSMQLQAGDTVTFSRLEPEGKLVMGFRKASSTASSSDQGKLVDPATAWSEVDKSAYIAKEMVGAKVSIHAKRKKGGKMGSNGKRLKPDSGEILQLHVALEQVQGLLRPPPSIAPTIVIINGVEFEDYQEAPIIGRPTLFSANSIGEKIQWAQCEDCSKWRKVPPDALLPSRWTCSENSWDPERSSCLTEEELTAEQLENMINQTSSSRKAEPGEAVEGREASSDMTIDNGKVIPASSQATSITMSETKHKSMCMCNVCLTMKRWSESPLHHGQKQSTKEAENTHQKLTQLQFGDLHYTDNHKMGTNGGFDDGITREKQSAPPFKSQNIDLNIQPEREDESPPVSHPMGMMRLVQESRYLKQHKLPINPGNRNHESTTL